MDLRCHGKQRLIDPNSLTDVFYIALYVLSIPHNVKYEAVQKWRTIKRCEEEIQLLKIEMQNCIDFFITTSEKYDYKN